MTNLRLYNTLTRAKEDFAPLKPDNVRMYVCGPTVYDFAHIGNARPVIVFDVLFRLLRHLYGESHVTYVRNITDIDDKINARAAERAAGRNIPILDVVREITNETGRVYDEDVAALGNLPPTVTPRATEHVQQMIAMIGELIAAGHAYPAEGHVLFDVSSKPDYGKLSRRPLDEMIAGARIEVAPYKKSPMDFVLWKPSDAAAPGWDSPWGRGRPGWHIECSAMAGQYLGETFDIHGGGIDLLFPHHENEIAQSESAHRGHALAKVWMHNGFLQVEGEKMSKSLGNFVTIHELLADWPGEVLRFNMLRTHYRQPTDWTLKGLEESQRTLTEWLTLAVAMSTGGAKYDEVPPRPLFPPILDALCDDLNTPKAIAEIHSLRNSIVHKIGLAPVVEFSDALRFLGLLHDEVTVALARIRPKARLGKEEIAQAIETRNAVRKAKNFKESDRIRDELLAQGIALKDNPDGTTSWEVKR
jgi:cysteinyl-tRNA synthetase